MMTEVIIGVDVCFSLYWVYFLLSAALSGSWECMMVVCCLERRERVPPKVGGWQTGIDRGQLLEKPEVGIRKELMTSCSP